ERILLDHPEITDYGHQDIFDALLVQGSRQMVMVDDVVALVRSHHDRNHVLADHLALLVRFLLAKPHALLLDLAHADGHLRRAQIEDWDRVDFRLAGTGHNLKLPWLAAK